ncbi:MAG: ABC transporter substrate-binding protein, partial [Xanthobacteraceae bacterium]
MTAAAAALGSAIARLSLFASEKILSERPETVKKFVRAYMKATLMCAGTNTQNEPSQNGENTLQFRHQTNLHFSRSLGSKTRFSEAR